MSRGDHIYVRRRRHWGRYSHHGIDCGDGSVIHYAGLPGSLRRVERTTFEVFAGDSAVLTRVHRRQLPAVDVMAKAESRLGAEDWHLVWNNCEHFATWCSTGSRASKQVRGWVMAAPGAVASVSAADAVGAHLMLLCSVVMGGVYAVTKPVRRRRRRLRVRRRGVDEPALG
jgi:hypothetical protein